MILQQYQNINILYKRFKIIWVLHMHETIRKAKCCIDVQLFVMVNWALISIRLIYIASKAYTRSITDYRCIKYGNEIKYIT